MTKVSLCFLLLVMLHPVNSRAYEDDYKPLAASITSLFEHFLARATPSNGYTFPTNIRDLIDAKMEIYLPTATKMYTDAYISKLYAEGEAIGFLKGAVMTTCVVTILELYGTAIMDAAYYYCFNPINPQNESKPL